MEEASKILYHAVPVPKKISSIFIKYFGKRNGIDLKVRHCQEPHFPIGFS